ncbi:SRPBCC family protein [Nocardia yamanashiensis]|uniref:SRPBCC family protein n=1 Tax=Nocardia yamanashiensis TaxID=209247 RepID=UPI000829A799|nr:SRPBCC family protein [Nocardia yamanashiensis]UGT40882.1 SRPBCC family protein [Nocardia yamanashiensis]
MPNNLEASIDIAAAPEKVWSVVSDLKRIREFSPQTLRMQPLGAVKTGTWTVNLNKAKGYVYPTTSRVVRFEPNKAIAFRMNENQTIWSYTLEPTATGTKLIQRRDTPNGVTWIVRKMIDGILGGEAAFENDLVAGMNETLGKIKRTVEA